MKRNLLKKLIAEGIGTFSLILFGCGSITINERFAGIDIPVPIVFGIVIAIMIYTFGHVSGAHFNPAVTLGFATVKRFKWQQVPAYWLAQFTGALLGVSLLYLILPAGESFGATVPALPVMKALIWEVIFTFTLMLVIISVATDSRAVGIMAGLAIGGTVTLDAFVGGAFTGASMNSARSFAPALFELEFGTLWVYFVGPFIGAVLAALVYEKIRYEPEGNGEIKNVAGCC